MGETEVILPSQNMIDFDFEFSNADSGSAGFTAPSSPARIGDYYFSAPTSPRHLSQFYSELDEFLMNNSVDNDARRNSVSLAVPFEWEEKPGVAKSGGISEDDFAFDVSLEMDAASLTADVLFDGGKIKPREVNKNSDILRDEGLVRGRERSVSSLSSRSGHRATRSLSPMRVSEYPWEEEFKHQQQQQQQQQRKNNQQNSKQQSSKPNLTSSVSALSSTSLKGHKKWKLKDFFLFRSASEGRATDKADPLKKYASLFKKQEDVRSSSFRSIHNEGNSVSKRKGKGPVSAHELHYTINRAVSEDLKKKTFLPYKQGILGRLSFNPAVHAIANGFGFSRK